MTQIAAVTSLGMLIFSLPLPAQAFPPPEDIPEEILREEIVLEGRSPLDGSALTASEYTQLMQELSQSPFPDPLPSEIRHQVFLLELLRFLQTVTPL